MRKKCTGELKKALSVLLPAAVAVSGIGIHLSTQSVKAANPGPGDVVRGAGSVDDFSKELPLTTVMIDVDKLTGENATVVSSKIVKDTSGVKTKDGDTVYTYVNESNFDAQSEYGASGTLYYFTYRDAAVLSDRTKADVVITYSDLKLYTNDGVSNDNDGNGTFGNMFTLGAGRAITIGAPDKHCTDEQAWRAGIEMNAKLSVLQNSSPVSGNMSFEMKGINVPRSGNAFTSIKDADKYNNFSEQVEFAKTDVTQPIYFPTGFVEIIDEKADTVRVVGKSDKNNTSYLTGFATQVDAGKGMNLTYRGGAGWRPKSGGRIQLETFIKTGDLEVRLDSWSTPGGDIKTTQDGNPSGDLSDGSTILGQGVYGAAKGKTVTYTMLPDNRGYKIKQVLIDDTDDVTDDVKATEKGTGNDRYYTYTFTDVKDDHELFVEWEPIAAEVDIEKLWEDDNDSAGKRADITVHVSGAGQTDILPAQNIVKDSSVNEQSVVWGSESGYTDAAGNVVADDKNSLEESGTKYHYFYDNETFKWKQYTRDAVLKKYTATGKVFDTDFLAKYDSSGNLVDYKVTEDALANYTTTGPKKISESGIASDEEEEKAYYKWEVKNSYDSTQQEEVKTLTRNITYRYIDENGNFAQDTRAQEVTLRRTQTAGVWSDWSADSGFSAITSPTQSDDPTRLKGWTPDRDVPEVTKDRIEAALKTDDKPVFDEEIYYLPPEPLNTEGKTKDEKYDEDGVLITQSYTPSELVAPDAVLPDGLGTQNEIEYYTLIDSEGNEVTELTTADGYYVINSETGEVTFTPGDDFAGKATQPVRIRAVDKLGAITGKYPEALYTPEVIIHYSEPVSDPEKNNKKESESENKTVAKKSTVKAVETYDNSGIQLLFVEVILATGGLFVSVWWARRSNNKRIRK